MTNQIEARLNQLECYIDEEYAERSQELHQWMQSVYRFPRSLTGSGVLETLESIRAVLPRLMIQRVRSGTPVFDWEVPPEWRVRRAQILRMDGTVVVDWADDPLHLVGYSIPVDRVISRDELDHHLHSLPDLPEAIPYVTSYYARRWGFCVSDTCRRSLTDAEYRVVIDTELDSDGELLYGELVIPGETPREIFLSTYICHPSMANNELSGPAVAMALADMLSSQRRLRHTYRIVFVPETIGSIVYLSRHLDHLKAHVDAGYVLTCVGDERTFSVLHSPTGKTLSDRAALQAFKELKIAPEIYSFLERGSDERQYCGPNVRLPMCSIMRSKYGTYPEYHTSLDNLSLVTPEGLSGSLRVYWRALSILEANVRLHYPGVGEPQLGRRGLYPTLGTRDNALNTRLLTNVLVYADGRMDLLEMASLFACSVGELAEVVCALVQHGLVSEA